MLLVFLCENVVGKRNFGPLSPSCGSLVLQAVENSKMWPLQNGSLSRPHKPVWIWRGGGFSCGFMGKCFDVGFASTPRECVRNSAMCGFRACACGRRGFTVFFSLSQIVSPLNWKFPADSSSWQLGVIYGHVCGKLFPCSSDGKKKYRALFQYGCLCNSWIRIKTVKGFSKSCLLAFIF